MKEYVVIYEWAGTNWSAYSPDVPGCIATGKTKQETETSYIEALEFHFEGLRADGLPGAELITEAGRVRVPG